MYPKSSTSSRALENEKKNWLTKKPINFNHCDGFRKKASIVYCSCYISLPQVHVYIFKYLSRSLFTVCENHLYLCSTDKQKKYERE